ncbi:hypothetical protein BpJC7_19070 [Weizmannia acidilactici]|uniref:Uncharacterized protein n=1 Tax=Weizmannia acidilactici TaxID=2607726 RepID=A0A5J4JNN4_9BACI|nr:hypothetical protein [Weizmannia acidilactici]GER68475.1 hypothetical protein BpJC4_29460 [Weizmannia acidilactici]GER70604.1 hypothetical protein BpJC7_19070 [Weizmannia acidilactici]
MGQGKLFSYKRKGHPGNFPKDQMTDEKQHKGSNYDEEQMIPHEAFKNSMHHHQAKRAPSADGALFRRRQEPAQAA